MYRVPVKSMRDFGTKSILQDIGECGCTCIRKTAMVQNRYRGNKRIVDAVFQLINSVSCLSSYIAANASMLIVGRPLDQVSLWMSQSIVVYDQSDRLIVQTDIPGFTRKPEFIPLAHVTSTSMSSPSTFLFSFVYHFRDTVFPCDYTYYASAYLRLPSSAATSLHLIIAKEYRQPIPILPFSRESCSAMASIEAGQALRHKPQAKLCLMSTTFSPLTPRSTASIYMMLITSSQCSVTR